MIIHVVTSGDTLYQIGNTYGVSPFRLAIDNGIPYDSTLTVGQTIVVQFPSIVHTVKQNESLYHIAQQYGVTVISLYQNNPQLHGLPSVIPGQQLVITHDQEKLGAFEVNGYGEPSISQNLLRQTLPYLTYVAPFTYGFTTDGNLIMLNDEQMISTANEYNTAALMHLSTLTESGGFDSSLAYIVLNNTTIQNKLIDEIIYNMRNKGYYGLDVDFEFINQQDGQKYAAFITNLRQRLNPLGYEVITALAPKISATQQGLLYQGHLYKEIGIASNAVFIMTYEWGYTYGPPMAVSPLPNVRAVLDYAITEIQRDKIFMGISNYGYDWTLPYRTGDMARSISNEEAVRLAIQYNAAIEFDQKAQAPFFYYYDDIGNAHVVWFEDARSIKAKLALIPEYGLRGAGYWNIMRPYQQGWTVLNSLYDIKRVR